jgi:hypothetical protein
MYNITILYSNFITISKKMVLKSKLFETIKQSIFDKIFNT